MQGADVYSFDPTVLLLADSAGGLARARGLAERSGARIVANHGIEQGAEWLAEQPAPDAVLVALTADVGRALDRLLDRLDQAAAEGRHRSVVILPPALMDLAAARAGHGDIALLCDADAGSGIAAVALALAGGRNARTHLAERDAAPLQLRQLSEEVHRIARTLAALSGAEDGRRPAVTLPDAPPPDPASLPSARTVRAEIRARRMRDQFFQGELFADPAWDMLLDLTAAHLEGAQVAVSSLCIAAAVPPTTALRWIKTLTDEGLFRRIADPRDGRRVFIALSDAALNGMLAYFVAIGRSG